ncbi:hypothetical protein EVAR_22758_1 [Eumeta japonica]|uniref:Secreted protein n=1 Tax=Eumeta variegata TaxID=151549 RepID=A0A4C1UTS4_EUMVA|nr:hypothetical protein EVAR_22758_1 [Eumeta japonica]
MHLLEWFILSLLGGVLEARQKVSGLVECAGRVARLIELAAEPRARAPAGRVRSCGVRSSAAKRPVERDRGPPALLVTCPRRRVGARADPARAPLFPNGGQTATPEPRRGPGELSACVALAGDLCRCGIVIRPFLSRGPRVALAGARRAIRLRALTSARPRCACAAHAYPT